MEKKKNELEKCNAIQMDAEYVQWISELAKRYRSSQIKASIKVNHEMIRFYWSIGEDIERRKYENRYGSHFYENVSRDLRHTLRLSRGMSETTIRYAHYFYCLYSQLLINRQQDADDLEKSILQQDAEDFQVIYQIPWTHHMCIIDKVKGDARKGLFFARKTMENGWGRGVLLNFLSTDLYERQGASQTNFALTMPAPDSDLAQELLKSPYDFRFLPGKEKYQEAELKNALIGHISLDVGIKTGVRGIGRNRTSGLVIGDYSALATDLFETGRISEGHYNELINPLVYAG